MKGVWRSLQGSDTGSIEWTAFQAVLKWAIYVNLFLAARWQNIYYKQVDSLALFNLNYNRGALSYISSRGEMKISLKLIIYKNVSVKTLKSRVVVAQTFSCRRCLSNFNSLYVRFASTEVLKGFMIFFTATACPVNWSFAELYGRYQRVSSYIIFIDTPGKPSVGTDIFPVFNSWRGGFAYQTSPKAPIPTGWRSVYLWINSVSISILETTDKQPCEKHGRFPAYLFVISNVVPNIWARTNSAILYWSITAPNLGKINRSKRE